MIPNWLTIGSWVNCGAFCGVITNIANAPDGECLVYVESLKERRLGRVGEWLPYIEGTMTEAEFADVMQDGEKQFRAIGRCFQSMQEFANENSVAIA